MRGSALVALVVTLVAGGLASAEPPVKDKAKSKAALTRFESGKTAYRLKDFDVAINEWREGYRINADPVFLFNIAQAYREKRQFTEAIDFYHSYLREQPDAPNKNAVLKRIAEMKEALAQEQRAAEKPPTGPLAPGGQYGPSPPPEPDEPPAPRRGGTAKISGIVLGVVGLGLVGGGIAFGVMARNDEAAVNDALAAGEPWSQALADRESSAKTKATLSNVAFAAGGVAVVGGVVLYVIGVRQGRRVDVIPDASSNGASVAVRVRW